MTIRQILISLLCTIQILTLAPYVTCYWNFYDYTFYKDSYIEEEECIPEAKEPWSYSGKNGPESWGERFPECNGEEQSPIAINSRSAIYDPKLEKLSMNNYNIPVKRATIENNGHTVEVTPTDGVERTILVEGSTYRLEQLHFHWGDIHNQGSEHTLNGIQYAMELHLVHRNAKDQIAVVAVFFQEQRYKHSELQNIIKSFPKVMFNDTRTELKSYLYLKKLLPAAPYSFYRYRGSLTTPECAEGVIWSVLAKPLPVAKSQMSEFYKLYSVRKSDANSKCMLVNNFRPVQSLNGRKVFFSK